MTVKLALVETLTAGLPRPLRFGMTAAELTAVLGDTDDVMPRSRRDQRPAIVRYGTIEFHFAEDEGLVFVFADYFDVPHGALELEVDAGWIAGSLQ